MAEKKKRFYGYSNKKFISELAKIHSKEFMDLFVYDIDKRRNNGRKSKTY